MATIRINTHPTYNYSKVMVCSGYVPWLGEWVRRRGFLWHGRPSGFDVYDRDGRDRQTAVADLVEELLEERCNDIKARRDRSEDWKEIERPEDLRELFVAR